MTTILNLLLTFFFFQFDTNKKPKKGKDFNLQEANKRLEDATKLIERFEHYLEVCILNFRI